jgi:choline dehydrogenase-like flavoprotein
LTKKTKPSICVIGAGPGGAILAIELAKSGQVEVIVVDIDGINEEFDQASSVELIAKYTGHPFGLVKTRGFGFGGSSNLWHGLLAQLDRNDWEGIDKLAGVQISTEIKDYYHKLDDYFPGVSSAFSFQKAPNTKIGVLYNELRSDSKFTLKDFFLH